MPHICWQIGGGSGICGPQGSSSGSLEWMSLRCWKSGPTANIVLAAGPILVARYGFPDAESDWQLQTMYQA